MSPQNNKRLRTTGGRGPGAARGAIATGDVGLVVAMLASLFLGGAAPAQTKDAADTLPATRFEGYPDAPAFSVVSRKDELFFYPCDQCHAAMEPNPEIRPLNVMHDAEIEHGRGRIWCTSCHYLENRNYLKTLLDEPVDFDDAHLVCGGCHANRHKDWVFGVHGKRVGNWQGERTLYDCAHCHNPHNPVIEPRAPKAPPPVRAGLERAIGAGHGDEAAHEIEEDGDQ